MSTSNRAALFTKAHKVLKKYYKPVEPIERPVLEHLLYACLLENTHYEQADKAFDLLKGSLFDWNEVRVSTVKELAEMVPFLPDAMAAVGNLRKVLFAVFESQYSYDLEPLKKLNLGVAQAKIQKYAGSTPFVVGYATQVTLGGHCIPIDRGSMGVLNIIVDVTDKERKEVTVSGLERAIPKNKGIEFGSLLHALGADMMANPYSTNLHKILLEINPDAKDRLPKRHAKKETPEEPAKPAPAASAKTVVPAKPAAPGKSAPPPADKGKKPAEPAKGAAPAKPAAPSKGAVPAKPAAASAKPGTPAKPSAKKEPAKDAGKKPSAQLQKKKPK
ncbi:MAG: hypothetical protein JNM18_13925 [Planctomycetaceae bacterium]|nr:hypothetical protein [Planctomycetaceae bacterium]